MFCKNCGNSIKEGVKFCPQCGEPIKEESTHKPASATLNQAIPSIASMTGPDSRKISQENSKTVSGEKLIQDAVQVTAGGLQGFIEKGRRVWKSFTGSSCSGKETGNKRLPVIVCMIAAAVLVLGIINGERLNNLIHKTFSSPAKYYQFVEKKTVKDIAKNAGEIYDSYILDALNFYDKSTNEELTVELGKDGQEFLGLLGLAGVDLSWLQSASVSIDTSIKNNTMSVGTAVSVNKNDLLSGNMIVDKDKERIYAQIPELNKSYMEFDISEETEEAAYYYGMSRSGMLMLQDALVSNKELVEACPDQAKVEKLVKRYMNLLVGCVDKVTKSKDTLSVEGISQKCTVLKVSIDSETMRDMAETVLEEMQNDKEVKSIIINILRTSEDVTGDVVDADEAYDNFQELLEELIDELEYLSYIDEEIIMKVYVDGKGNIVGRNVKIGDMAVNMLMPEKGGKFGYELSYKMYGVDVKLTGSGKRSGDKINGDFQAKYNGASILDITAKKLNTKDLKKGQMNGRLEVKAASKIGNLVGYIPGFSAIEDIKLTFDFDSSKKSHVCKIGLIYDRQDIGSVSLSVKTGKGSMARIPDSKKAIMIEDVDDISEWIEGIDLKNLIASMKKAGMPSEVTDALEEADDMFEDADLNSLMRLMYYFY